jgi:hypothetical protein
MMKKLVGNAMSVLLEIVLWLIPVACAVLGYIICGSLLGLNYIIGIILGILVGFVLDIFIGGSFLLLMEIRNYVKEIAEKR